MKGFIVMKSKLKLFGIYLPVFCVIILATVTMRTVALLVQFDFKTGYFSENVLISIADYMTVALSLFLFSYVFYSRKDLKLIPDFSSPATYVPTGLTSAALVFIAISLFGADKRSSAVLDLLAYVSAALAILSAVNFIVMALSENWLDTKRVYLGLSTVLFLSFYTAYLYFDTTLPINSPNKVLDQMAYLFAAVFFLYETRLSMKREKWRLYIAFGFIAAAISAYSAIPSLIVYFAKGKTVSDSIYEIALTLALFIFIISRVLLTGELIEDRKSGIASTFIAFAKKRDEELNPLPSTASVVEITGESLAESEEDFEDESQITIDDVQEGEIEEDVAEPTPEITESEPEDDAEITSEEEE